MMLFSASYRRLLPMLFASVLFVNTSSCKERRLPPGVQLHLRGGPLAQCQFGECKEGLRCVYGKCKPTANSSAAGAGAAGTKHASGKGAMGSTAGRTSTAKASSKRGWQRFSPEARAEAAKKLGQACRTSADCGINQFCGRSEQVCVALVDCEGFGRRIRSCGETIWKAHYPRKARRYRRGSRTRQKAIAEITSFLFTKLVTPCSNAKGMFRLRVARWLNECTNAQSCTEFNHCLFKKAPKSKK